MPVYGWDLETDRLSPYQPDSRLLTGAFATKARAWGYVFDHPLDRDTTDGELHERVFLSQALLGDPKNTVVGHSITSFDIAWWEFWTKQRVEAQWFDTRVAQSLINENSENSLAYLAELYTDLRADVETKAERKKLASKSPADVLAYNIKDAEISYALYAPMKAALEAEGMEKLFAFLMRVSRTLVDMSVRGMYLDVEWVAEQRVAIAAEREEVEERLNAFVGRPVNLGSTKQLAALLYDYYRMPVVVRSKKTNAPSTSEEALLELKFRAQNEVARTFIDDLLLYRELKKLDGTYLGPLITKHRGIDGRVHTTFHVGRGEGAAGRRGGTVTGRLSSSDPNLQNIPRDKRVKGALAAQPGTRLFVADYSQLELRIAAYLAREPTMLKAFAEGRDVHTATLAEMEDVSYEHVIEALEAEDQHWTEQRALIKRINFGILYGVGPGRLVKLMRGMGINITFGRAVRIINQWRGRYTAITDWIDTTQAEAEEQGYIVTFTGRKRRVGDVDMRTFEGQRAARQAVNAKVQSPANDINLTAMELLDKKFEIVGGAQLVDTVHDSSIGEYAPEDWPDQELTDVIRSVMVTQTLTKLHQEFGVPLDIPLAVDIKLGLERWS